MSGGRDRDAIRREFPAGNATGPDTGNRRKERMVNEDEDCLAAVQREIHSLFDPEIARAEEECEPSDYVYMLREWRAKLLLAASRPSPPVPERSTGTYPCADSQQNQGHDTAGPCRACRHVHNPYEGYCVKCRVERFEAALDFLSTAGARKLFSRKGGEHIR